MTANGIIWYIRIIYWSNTGESARNVVVYNPFFVETLPLSLTFHNVRTWQVPPDHMNLMRTSRIYRDQVEPVGAHWFQGTKEDHFNQHYPLS